MEITEDEAKMQMLPADRSMSVTFHDNIAVIEMNYGENRFNVTFMNELNKALDKVENNPKVEALITTGKGKFYSNGIDLDFMAYVLGRNPTKELDFRNKGFNPLIARLLTFPVPTIAAINGHAFAGGGILAFCHDYRIMQTERGWLCLNEVRLGLAFNTFLLKMLELKICSGSAHLDLVIMGKRYTAAEALKNRLITSMCQPNELLTHSRSFAKSLLTQGAYNREYFSNMKKQVFSKALEHTTKSGMSGGFTQSKL